MDGEAHVTYCPNDNERLLKFRYDVSCPREVSQDIKDAMLGCCAESLALVGSSVNDNGWRGGVNICHCHILRKVVDVTPVFVMPVAARWVQRLAILFCHLAATIFLWALPNGRGGEGGDGGLQLGTNYRTIDIMVR